jgi:hypothetical protein
MSGDYKTFLKEDGSEVVNDDNWGLNNLSVPKKAHHHETFISKYIFSMDHKMIGKQFLITAIFMAVIGMGMSILFRLQLAWPKEGFAFLNFFSRRQMGT